MWPLDLHPDPSDCRCKLHIFQVQFAPVFQVQFARILHHNLHQNGANACANCTRYLHHFGANCTFDLHCFGANCTSHLHHFTKNAYFCRNTRLVGANPFLCGANPMCNLHQQWCKLHVAICTKLVQIHGAICTWIYTILVQVLVQIRCKWHWDLHHFGANMSANGTWICTMLVQILVQMALGFALLVCKWVPKTQF